MLCGFIYLLVLHSVDRFQLFKICVHDVALAVSYEVVQLGYRDGLGALPFLLCTE